jgi:octaprenyl-diphosphate synthase
MSLAERHDYLVHLDAVRSLTARLVTQWAARWAHAAPLGAAVSKQLSRDGKSYRPTMALAVCNLLSSDPTRAYPVAASAEIYHAASLIFDDIEDNSDRRGGDTTMHATVGMSTAINVAGVIRSLSYHAIESSTNLTDPEKYALRRRLDHTSTVVPIGQGMDIGWQLGWYRSVLSFPYESMVAMKTGALFGYAAWGAAATGSTSDALVDRIADLATEIGSIYQLIDDFVDTFGQAGPGLPDDVRDGKITYPVVLLARALDRDGRGSTAADLFEAARTRNWASVQGERLLGLLVELGIESVARADLHRRIDESVKRIESIRAGIGGGLDFPSFISSWHDLIPAEA